MKKLLAVLGFLLALAGAGVDFQHGDSRVSLWNHALRHWNLVENAHLFKPGCAAGLVPSGGGPCGGAGSYALTGPTNGNVNSSLTYTIQPNGASTATITPSDTSHGGIFTPSTVNLSGDTSPRTFTYQPLQTGTFNISTTNSGSLTNPSPISFTSGNLAPGYPNFAAGWTTSASTITTAQADPFGGTSAILLTDTATNGYHFIFSTSAITVTSGHAYNMGVAVKNGVGSLKLDLSLYNSTNSAGGTLTITPSSCTATAGAFGGFTTSSPIADTINLSTGWCLVTFTVIPNATSVFINLFMDNGGQVYAGGSNTLSLYGPILQ